MRRLPRYSGPAQCACSRCRRLRSSGTLAAILPAPEDPAGLLQASPAATGNGDTLDIPALLNACVAAAAGCDRAARSRRSCRRRRPFGSIAASRGSAAATGNGDTLDIPAPLNACVAAAAGCDRAARSRRSCRRRRPFGSIAGCASGYRDAATSSIFRPCSMRVAAAAGCDRAVRSRRSCRRRRPFGSIAACASGYRGERGGYRSPWPGRSQAITHIPICSRSVLKGTSPIWRRPALA